MIGAIVMYHHQERNFMVRGGPKHAISVHQVAVALDGDGDDAFVAVGEGPPDTPRRRIADPRTAGAAEEIIIFRRRPEIAVPLHTGRGNAPFFILYGVVKSRRHARRAARARVPARARFS